MKLLKQLWDLFTLGCTLALLISLWFDAQLGTRPRGVKLVLFVVVVSYLGFKMMGAVIPIRKSEKSNRGVCKDRLHQI